MICTPAVDLDVSKPSAAVDVDVDAADDDVCLLLRCGSGPERCATFRVARDGRGMIVLRK